MLQTSAEHEVKASNSSPESRRVCEKLILQTVPSFPAPPQLLFTIYWCFFSCSTSCYCCSVAKNSLNINSRMGDTCRTSRGTRDPRVKRSSSALFQQREPVWFIGGPDRFLKALGCFLRSRLCKRTASWTLVREKLTPHGVESQLFTQTSRCCSAVFKESSQLSLATVPVTVLLVYNACENTVIYVLIKNTVIYIALYAIQFGSKQLLINN